MSDGILEKGTLVFFCGLMTGLGGSGGESARVMVALTLVTFVTFLVATSESESLSEVESDEEDFLESVALESDSSFLAGFLSLLDPEDSLSDPELELEESLSESGKGTFCAVEFVEESESEVESESEDEESLDSPLSLEEEDSEEDSEEESLSDELDGDSTTFVLAFFGFGASSSELESELEDEALLMGALRFSLPMVGFGVTSLTTGASLSSSASLEASLSLSLVPESTD